MATPKKTADKTKKKKINIGDLKKIKGGQTCGCNKVDSETSVDGGTPFKRSGENVQSQNPA